MLAGTVPDYEPVRRFFFMLLAAPVFGSGSSFAQYWSTYQSEGAHRPHLPQRGRTAPAYPSLLQHAMTTFRKQEPGPSDGPVDSPVGKLMSRFLTSELHVPVLTR